jgi:hypothetical protein
MFLELTTTRRSLSRCAEELQVRLLGLVLSSHSTLVVALGRLTTEAASGHMAVGLAEL